MNLFLIKVRWNCNATRLRPIAKANDKTVFNLSDKNIKLKIAKKTQKQAMFTKNRTSFTLATEVFSGI